MPCCSPILKDFDYLGLCARPTSQETSVVITVVFGPEPGHVHTDVLFTHNNYLTVGGKSDKL